MLGNLLRGVTWLAAPSKGPARLITWREISELIEHCLGALEQGSDTCHSEVGEECWLLSVLYQHLDETALALDTAAPLAALHRRVIRSAVQHMTRVNSVDGHVIDSLPLLRVLNMLLVDWHAASWSECELSEHVLLSLVARCLSSTAA